MLFELFRFDDSAFVPSASTFDECRLESLLLELLFRFDSSFVPSASGFDECRLESLLLELRRFDSDSAAVLPIGSSFDESLLDDDDEDLPIDLFFPDVVVLRVLLELRLFLASSSFICEGRLIGDTSSCIVELIIFFASSSFLTCEGLLLGDSSIDRLFCELFLFFASSSFTWEGLLRGGSSSCTPPRFSAWSSCCGIFSKLMVCSENE